MADGTSDLVVEIARRIRDRYYGKYRGRVVDNADPQGLARLKLTVPSALGTDAVTGWALPCLPFGGLADQGTVLIPEIDAQVWVEFEEGDLSRPVWTGTFWTAEQPLPAEAGTPSVRLIKTAAGHLLAFDDTDGSETFTLRHPAGAEVTIDSQGTVTLKDAGGNSITLDAGGKIVAADATGASLTLEGGAATMADAAGAKVEISGGSINLKAAATITLDAATVMLGGAGGEPVLKGLSFLAAYATHFHPTGVGPSGPPVPGAEMSSTSAKVLTS